MIISRRRFLKTVSALVLVSFADGAAANAPETLTIQGAINKAGRQRMLSQRIAKAYCQIGLNVSVPQSRKILATSFHLFDTQLQELLGFAPTAEIKQTYQQLAQQWGEYKALVAAQPVQASAGRVAALSDVVLKTANTGTGQLVAYAGTNGSQLINLSGRQRMLSQRMAKFYMLRSWNVDPAEASRGLASARTEFVAAMGKLKSARRNTSEIKDGLELVNVQWIFFNNAISQQTTGGLDPTLALNVATTSERILEVMNHVTGMYERLAEKSAGSERHMRKK